MLGALIRSSESEAWFQSTTWTTRSSSISSPHEEIQGPSARTSLISAFQPSIVLALSCQRIYTENQRLGPNHPPRPNRITESTKTTTASIKDFWDVLQPSRPTHTRGIEPVKSATIDIRIVLRYQKRYAQCCRPRARRAENTKRDGAHRRRPKSSEPGSKLEHWTEERRHGGIERNGEGGCREYQKRQRRCRKRIQIVR